MTLETFKSPSFATPFTKNMFADLTSRCIILLWCKNFNPFKMSKATFQTKFSSNFQFLEIFFSIKPARSPPSANSITMDNIFPHYWKKAPLYLITFGESIDARSLTSLSALSFYFGVRDIILMVFMAKNPRSSFRLTLRTLPKLPLPSYLMTSNQCIVLFILIEELYNKEVII